MNTYINDYLNYIAVVKEVSENTVTLYTTMLKEFSEYFANAAHGGVTDIKNMQIEDINRYVNYLHDKGNGVSTRRTNGLSDKSFNVHSLRKTCASLMNKSGVDINSIKEILGHENVVTTNGYIQVWDEDKEEAVNKLNNYYKGVNNNE